MVESLALPTHDVEDDTTFKTACDPIWLWGYMANRVFVGLPRLMLAALQVNIRGGRLPEPEANGRSYLKLPLDYFEAR